MFLVFCKKFLFIIYLLCLFLAVLGPRLCTRAFSSCGEWGPLFIAVRGPVTIAAPPVAEQRLQTLRLSSRGPRAQPLRGMWDPPRPGPEPVSPAPAGRFSTTAPPGKPVTPPLNLSFRKCETRLPLRVVMRTTRVHLRAQNPAKCRVNTDMLAIINLIVLKNNFKMWYKEVNCFAQSHNQKMLFLSMCCF